MKIVSTNEKKSVLLFNPEDVLIAVVNEDLITLHTQAGIINITTRTEIADGMMQVTEKDLKKVITAIDARFNCVTWHS